MAGPARGALHGRDTWSWRLNSSWFVLIGGARAAIMQVAEPKIGAGVAQHSAYRTDPLGRLERTLDAMLTVGFGTPEQKDRVLEELRQVHSAVRGRTEEGAPYSALDPQLVGEVLDTLRLLASEGMTMICVTHEMKFAREVSDRVAFFHKGVMAEIAPPEELFGAPKDPELQKFLAATH